MGGVRRYSLPYTPPPPSLPPFLILSVTADGRGRVLVWAVKTHIIKSEVNVCRNVLDIDWSPDGKRIVAVGDGSDS